ncbi:hypothetical protein MUP79_09205 [Candidatus Bathyarchaeota archaeon]|nr:hypothetical protein [Candidatus Bathyarchaeota archaeon]
MKMKLKLVVASVLAILTLSLPVFMVHALPSGITVDGDPSDWTAFGLSAVGTDPPYNTPHSFNPISSDLLEVWTCKNDTHLFLMMKVRGGTPDITDAGFIISINVDPGQPTGDQGGDDYFVSASNYGGSLYRWNITTLTWDYVFSSESNVACAHGGLGYIEWGVPVSAIGGNVSNLELDFYTYDKTFNSETVNQIIVTLSPPATIPEFPSLLLLLLPLVAVMTAIMAFKKSRHA